ncbi:hypothetical protein PPERSA_11777 [Pseudocohnilembus persalinus]|uniref:PARP-type domain-containing protein n=1 Tax=Pseudocohnilembus persalinus TaxID=266149 RepID=A0A0V0QGI9_PSEPJ|nr:hypothetical protein PPERSA_11777 [Pseudocohnilembus persalinus]|eukprot:KRX01330.1 hypothetical protein PPERSA_11777 [Pseudocohnilembus persalinus]
MIQFKIFDLDCISVENAKSDRGECKSCGNKVSKGDIKISHTIYFDPEHQQRNPTWCHLKCFKLPEKFQKISFWEIEGGDNMSASDKNKIMKALSIPEGEESMLPKNEPIYIKQKEIVELEDQVVMNKTEFKKYKSLLTDLKSKTVPQLVEMLKKNNQVLSSKYPSKDSVLNRVAECKVLGARYPYCPKCGNAGVKFSLQKGLYHCSGYLDDVDWLKCNTFFKNWKRIPWVE